VPALSEDHRPRRTRAGQSPGRWPPAAQRTGGAIERERQVSDDGPGADLVKPELELDHDAEVAAAPPQSPEQVGVLFGRGTYDIAVGSDNCAGHHVVAGEAVLARQPAHTATKC
jgi:hypothetical protein